MGRMQYTKMLQIIKYIYNVIYLKSFIKVYKYIAYTTYTVYMMRYSLISYKNIKNRKATVFTTA